MTSTTPKEFSSDAVALALMAADMHFSMDANYHRALEKVVFDGDSLRGGFDLKDQRRAESKLRSQEAKHALTFIWRSSDHVTLEMLIKAGYTEVCVSKNLNSNSLATDFCRVGGVGDPSAYARIKQDITRIVESANMFHLIDFFPDPTGKNCKPFKGTERLHSLMCRVHLKNAKLIQKLTQGPEITQKRVVR